MPTIPRYTQQNEMPTTTGGVLQPVQSAGAVGQAMATAGKGLVAATDELAKAYATIQRQKEDSQLIEVGAKINDAALAWEQTFKQTNKGIAATGFMEQVDSFTDSLMKDYLAQAPSQRYADLVKHHILAKGTSLKTSLASFAAEQLKDYHRDVREQDLVSSIKMAQEGHFNEALVNYRRTLDAQLMNGTLSDTDYESERLKAEDRIADAYIMSRDPVGRKTAFELLSKHLLPSTIAARKKEIDHDAAQDMGKKIGDQIFDKGGTLTEQYKAVAAMNLDPLTAKTAEARIAERHHLIEEDRRIQERDAMEKFYASVMPRIEKRGTKMMLPSDLAGPEWEAYKRLAPDNAAKLAEHVQTNVRQMMALERQARSEALHQKRMEQDALELELMSDPNLPNLNVFEYDLRPDQMRRLMSMKEKLDPTKRASVKEAINKIKTGRAMREALGVTDANELTSWQLKYSSLVREFAVAHAQDPDFDEKLNDYVQKYILSDVFMKWLPFYRGFHEEKHLKAKKAIGEYGAAPARPQPAQALVPQAQAAVPAPSSGDEQSLRNMAIAVIQRTPGVPLTEGNIKAAMEQLRGYRSSKQQRSK